MVVKACCLLFLIWYFGNEYIYKTTDYCLVNVLIDHYFVFWQGNSRSSTFLETYNGKFL